MPTSLTSQYVQASLTPYKWAQKVLLEDYQVAANAVIVQGGIVAMLTGANTDDVQTLTNTATGGTFQITVGNALTSVTANLTCTTLTAAQLQTALNAAYAALCPGVGTTGFVTVTTTTPFSSGAGALVVTFNNGTAHTGPLSNNPQTLMVINNTAATGGSVTVAHTTTGINSGAITNYINTIVADPTAAPSLTGGGSDGTFDVGAQTVAYTYVTAAGESRTGAEAGITLTSTQHIAVATINSIPTGVVSLNFYVNGYLAVNKTVSAGSVTGFNILAPAATTSPIPPKVSTAYLNGDGSQVPIGAAWYGMASAPNGVITFGAPTPSGNEYRPNLYTGNAAIAGYFQCANLFIGGVSGVDQNTVSTLGRLTAPSLTTGVLLITGA